MLLRLMEEVVLELENDGKRICYFEIINRFICFWDDVGYDRMDRDWLMWKKN